VYLAIPFSKGSLIPGFELCMLDDVIGPHPVENKLGLVGHPHDVVLHGVRQQPTFVDLKMED
jgi:hypothetical protein